MEQESHPLKNGSDPPFKHVVSLSKTFHGIHLSVLKWYGIARLFVLVALVVSVLHFDLSLRFYQHKLRTIPPRSSPIDRSRDFHLVSSSRLYLRHNTPWYKYPDLQPSAVNHVLPVEDSNYRFLISTAPDELDESIAHRFLVLNFERMVADMLNLTFIDRHHTYGSLTRTDNYAVENFFGWNSPDFFNAVCAQRRRLHAPHSCNKRLVICSKLQRRNPFVDSIVALPADLALCARHPHTLNCRTAIAAFHELHPWHRTLFHMPVSLCQAQLAYADQRATRGWHFSRYWLQPRAAKLDPRCVNIAVRVRRTDAARWRPRRADGTASDTGFAITDRAYAAVIAQVIDVVHRVESAALAQTDRTARMRLVFRVHIYSEGLSSPRAWHPLLRWMVRRGEFGRDVNDFDTGYVADDGFVRAAGYWESLLDEAFGKGSNNVNTKVDLHVSEDVLEGLEQMIAADVFIGSAAAVSVHLVGLLSRGIVFLPVRTPRGAVANKTIEWNPEGGYGGWSAWEGDDSLFFNKGEFEEVWVGYRKHIGAHVMPLGLLE